MKISHFSVWAIHSASEFSPDTFAGSPPFPLFGPPKVVVLIETAGKLGHPDKKCKLGRGHPGTPIPKVMKSPSDGLSCWVPQISCPLTASEHLS